VDINEKRGFNEKIAGAQKIRRHSKDIIFPFSDRRVVRNCYEWSVEKVRDMIRLFKETAVASEKIQSPLTHSKPTGAGENQQGVSMRQFVVRSLREERARGVGGCNNAKERGRVL